MNKIKKVVIILFTVMIVILCHTIGANKHLVLASEQQSVEYKVAISLLNVRTDAGVSNPVVTQLSSGEIVSITKMKKVGTVTWGYGHANGVSGWMPWII